MVMGQLLQDTCIIPSPVFLETVLNTENTWVVKHILEVIRKGRKIIKF